MNNSVAASRISHFRGNEMAAYDRLPPPIRRALQQAVIEWDARWIRWLFNKSKKVYPQQISIEKMVILIQESDDNEIELFKNHWPARFGKYPHVAAQATILRAQQKTPQPEG
jgi:TRAP-type C4-dicarboxylate transport system substrate-binding protein